MLDLIEQSAEERGSDYRNFEVSIHGMVNINDDKRAAYDEVEVLFQQLLYVRAIRPKSCSKSGSPMALPRNARDLIQGWIDMGITTPVLRFTSRNQIGQMERFIKDVLPLLRLK